MGFISSRKNNHVTKVLKTITLILILVPQCSYAEFKDMKCTYLLTKNEMNEFSDYKECPSGIDGLGKPWRWDTIRIVPVTKNNPSSQFTAVVIEKEICTGQKDKFFSSEGITPTLVIIAYGDRYAHYGHHLEIHRDTLVGIDGEVCEYIEEKSHECPGMKYPYSGLVMDMCF